MDDIETKIHRHVASPEPSPGLLLYIKEVTHFPEASSNLQTEREIGRGGEREQLAVDQTPLLFKVS